MIAFNGVLNLKEYYLSRVKGHQDNGEILPKLLPRWTNGRGTAAGCTIHNTDLAAYEWELGIPLVLAHLKEHIFHWLPPEKATKWPYDFLCAIQEGADLAHVWRQFVVILLVDPTDGIVRRIKGVRPMQIVERIAALLKEGCTDQQRWGQEAVLASDLACTLDTKTAEYHAVTAAQLAAFAMKDSLQNELLDPDNGVHPTNPEMFATTVLTHTMPKEPLALVQQAYIRISEKLLALLASIPGR